MRGGCDFSFHNGLETLVKRLERGYIDSVAFLDVKTWVYIQRIERLIIDLVSNGAHVGVYTLFVSTSIVIGRIQWLIFIAGRS